MNRRDFLACSPAAILWTAVPAKAEPAKVVWEPEQDWLAWNWGLGKTTVMAWPWLLGVMTWVIYVGLSGPHYFSGTLDEVKALAERMTREKLRECLAAIEGVP